MTKEFMKRLFIDALEAESSVFDSYDDSNERTTVLKMNGENLKEINIYVSFGVLDDGSLLATIGCYDLPNFKGRVDAGIVACNHLNDEEMVKYYIDDEDDAVAHATLVFNSYGISNDFAPKQVLSVAAMMAISVDDAYVVLEKAKWAN